MDKTTYEVLYGKKSNVSYFRVFGSKASVHVHDAKREKLDAKSVMGIMVGYVPIVKDIDSIIQ